MRHVGNQPWVLHLSYVKPHWPYMAPAPYHAMYSAEQCLPVVRSDAELRNAAPGAGRVPPAGRVRELPERRLHPHRAPGVPGPDQPSSTTTWAVCFDAMAASGRLDDTLIVFCSDHGDFLGDHWLGEKGCSTTPCSACRSSSWTRGANADATRGTVETALRRMRGRGAHDPRRAGHRSEPAPPPHRGPQPAAVAARAGADARVTVARLRLQRARLQLSTKRGC